MPDLPHLPHKHGEEPDRLVGGIAPRMPSCLQDNPVAGLKNDVTLVQAQHDPRVDGDDEVDGSGHMEAVTIHSVQRLVSPLTRRAGPGRQFGKRPERSAGDRLVGGERLPQRQLLNPRGGVGWVQSPEQAGLNLAILDNV